MAYKPGWRKMQWIKGRIAAKHAARAYIHDCCGVEPDLNDINISLDQHGRPYISINPKSKLSSHQLPCLSISHAGTLSAVAVSKIFPSTIGIGLDIEHTERRLDGLFERGFCPEEQTLLTKFISSKNDRLLLHCWCAKETIAKTFGTGLFGDPTNFILHDIRPDTGIIEIYLAERYRKQFQIDRNEIFSTFTGYLNNHIFAVSIV